MIPAKEIDGELWIKASDHHQAIKEALAQPAPVQEPVAWNVIDPFGNIVATEKNAIRGWARVEGYKPTVEGLLGFHEKGWRVLPAAQPAPVQGPDWKEEYQKAVDLHCLTLDELREANVEIKRLKAMVESQDMVLVRSAERIVDLQTHIENLEGET
jgi:hypothetical protein